MQKIFCSKKEEAEDRHFWKKALIYKSAAVFIKPVLKPFFEAAKLPTTLLEHVAILEKTYFEVFADSFVISWSVCHLRMMIRFLAGKTPSRQTVVNGYITFYVFSFVTLLLPTCFKLVSLSCYDYNRLFRLHLFF